MTQNQNVEFAELGNRLNEIRRHFRLSQKKLAQLVEGNQSGVSSVLSGKRKIPRIWYIQLGNKYPQLNINWLRTGEGEMLLSNTPEESSPRPSAESSIKFNAALTRDDMERLILRLNLQVQELTGMMDQLQEDMRVLRGLVSGEEEVG